MCRISCNENMVTLFVNSYAKKTTPKQHICLFFFQKKGHDSSLKMVIRKNAWIIFFPNLHTNN